MVEHFIRDNGYITVFLMVALSGEFGLIAGVALARTGSVTLSGVIILGTIASFIGNMFYYFLGKFLWNKWHFLKKKFGVRVEVSSRIVRRYGSPLMLLSRFFYGVRNIVPIALGLYEVSMGPFVFYNIVGAFIWAWFFTEAGGLVSSYLIKNLSNIRNVLLWGVAAIVILGILYILIRKFISRLER
ncbi:MAG: DedA family protein [Bacteroidetes bacterium]|nr:DedA family protein [Bacteroidota bacterium]MCL5268652.1 DedA family protein [Bacteroidota bacterium]